MRDPADPTALANLAALLTGAACDRPRAHTLLSRAFDANPSDARVAAAYAPPAPPPPPLSPSQCSDCCSCSGPLACCSRDSSLLQVSEGWLGRVLSCRDDVVVQFDDGSQVAPYHTIAPRLRCTPSS